MSKKLSAGKTGAIAIGIFVLLAALSGFIFANIYPGKVEYSEFENGIHVYVRNNSGEAVSNFSVNLSDDASVIRNVYSKKLLRSSAKDDEHTEISDLERNTYRLSFSLADKPSVEIYTITSPEGKYMFILDVMELNADGTYRINVSSYDGSAMKEQRYSNF